MFIKKPAVLFTIFAAFLVVSCSTPQSEIVVAKYGDKEIKMAEFEKAYTKNAGSAEKAKTDSISQYSRFLDLFVTFKMRLGEADSKGYAELPEVKKELVDYKRKVGASYIIEKEMIDPAIRDMYERRKKEFRVSHIMIRPDSADSPAPKKLAQSILDSIKSGRAFEEFVAAYSQDEYSKLTGGDIYYFTSGMVIPEFEDAVVKTKAGDVYPEIVTTRFGYHIIKVTEIRDRVPQVRASHILIDYTTEDGNQDTAAALAKIKEIQKMLKEGKSFEELARQYSEDFGTRDQGGDLNFFERRYMEKPFDEAAFNLKKGEVSDIVQTVYGYHLIKVTDIKPMPSFDEEKENLKRLYRQLRYPNEYAALQKNLLAKYGYAIDPAVENELASLCADTVTINAHYMKMDWRDQIKDKVLFTVSTTEQITVDSLMNFLSKRYEFLQRPINKALIEEGVNRLASELILEVDALYLDQRNEEFAGLMNDYKNGVFIFRLLEEEIWNKIKPDSLTLLAHYEKTKDNYRWNDRVQYMEIYSKSDSLINVYYEQLKAGVPFDTLALKYTERQGQRSKSGKTGLVEVSSSNPAKVAYSLSKEGDYSAPFKDEQGQCIVMLVKKDPSRIKTFEEAKPDVMGSYQDQETKRLEDEYAGYLINKYKPEYFYENLKYAYKTDTK
ncbi:MAG: peptidylprolyl isomerase [Ignavibacteriaceae bacterium]|nr:peptidylprolyl isomerase [Ignavibacteriaceae bacterium]